MFSIKKLVSLALSVLIICGGVAAVENAHAKDSKIDADCVFSLGGACRPAQWLRKEKMRFQSCPLDWMMKYSLDTALHFFGNKFSDFFENAKATGEIIGSHRVVKDTKHEIVSMHHFSKNMSLESAKKEVRNTMLNRAKKVDEVFKKSDSIVFVCNRNKASVEDFKKFLKGFDKIYPKKKITIINVYDNNSNKVNKKTLFEEKNLKLIQYSFNDVSPDKKKYPDWEGNPFGWKEVLGDIRLSKKASGNNVDYKKVEF